ncbi:MAG: LacI family DNA-binding transcriptional regulator [Fimbriimonas sp.]|nr:LacI family DNA-binding transcriptional regulator [Fimbriimonas sp.]
MDANGEERLVSRRVTIKEVAKRAGVGTMTVSRVVRNHGYVSDSVRIRVAEAVRELGYRPNGSARSLRLRRTDTIALIVSDITNPFFTTIARAVEDVASESDNLVLFGNTDESESSEIRYMEMVLQKGVDGVLLVPATDGRVALELAQASGLPVVAIDRRVSPAFDCVRCDSEGGAALLADRLLELGHRRFAILGGPDEVSTSHDRIQGFRLRAEAKGGQVTVYHGKLTVVDGERLTRVAMEANPRPTAIFAVNNFLSFGALNAVGALGLNVPDEVSVAGFDDLPESMVNFPFLTVVSQPAYELGALAARHLFERIQNPALPPQDLALPTTLRERSSTGPRR